MKQRLHSSQVSYELMDFLGEGLNGTVYRAVRSDSFEHLQQTVAIKILKSRNLVEIWKREFESLSAVSSPHCVRLFGFEWVGDRPALVLEYVDGVSLRQLCLSGAMSPTLAAEILAQIQTGLDALTAHGLAHGDLSPNNIMITVDGTVKLLDFGCCKEGAIQATPQFTAPELNSGQAPDFVSDLFSLGVIEEMLIGMPTARRSSDRHLRTRYPGLTKPSSRQDLARAIRNLVFEQNRFRNLTTRSIAFVRRTRWPVWRCALALCLVLVAPPAQPNLLTPTSALRVRTARWIALSLDGHNVGFSPRDFVIPSGTHEIRWKSLNSSGHIEFFLRPGEIKILKDEDFPIGDIAL